MKYTVEDVLAAADRKSFTLTREQAEELLTISPNSMQVHDVSVYWDDDEGELIIHANPQHKPQFKPAKIPSRSELSTRLKKTKRVIHSSGSPSPKPPKP
ncbi:hypothetical protein WJU79_004242 [Citrobacter freundii]